MTHHPGTPTSISSSPSSVSGALAASLLLAAPLLLSYAALRDVPSARLVLRHHPLRLRSAFLWNSPSRALASAALPAEALRVYNRMARSGVAPDDGTFPFALHAAAVAAGERPDKVCCLLWLILVVFIWESRSTGTVYGKPWNRIFSLPTQ
jgi:pentatricopeptide repeat protein